MFKPFLIIQHDLINVGFLLNPTTAADVTPLIITLNDFEAHPLDVTTVYLLFELENLGARS